MTEIMTPETLGAVAMIIAVAACCLVEWLTPTRPVHSAPSFAGLNAASARPARRGWTVRIWRDNTPWASRSVRCARLHAAFSVVHSPFFRPSAGKYGFAMIELNSHGQKVRRLDGVENCGAADAHCQICRDDIWADDPGWVAGPLGSGFLCQFHADYRKYFPPGPPATERDDTPSDRPRAAFVKRTPANGSGRFSFPRTPAAILRRAADLIERTGLAKGGLARRADKTLCTPHDEDARQFCAMGAMGNIIGKRAWEIHTGRGWDAYARARRMLAAIILPTSSGSVVNDAGLAALISKWNDAENQTPEKVAAAMRQAAGESGRFAFDKAEEDARATSSKDLRDKIFASTGRENRPLEAAIEELERRAMLYERLTIESLPLRQIVLLRAFIRRITGKSRAQYENKAEWLAWLSVSETFGHEINRRERSGGRERSHARLACQTMRKRSRGAF